MVWSVFLAEVEDDGAGFDPLAAGVDRRTHVGPSNVQSRLAAMCGGSLEVKSAPGVGTDVLIFVPKGGRGRMRLIAVDDEPLALKDLLEALEEAVPGAGLHGFSTARRALAFARESRVDAAFLDIDLGSANGLSLAKQLNEIDGGTNIMFTTSYPQYAAEAFSLYASGYLLKPVRMEDICAAMARLRTPPCMDGGQLRVRAFGNFEVFANGAPLHFARSKSKELFAYLVHKKGTGCTLKELAATLFEDREYNASLPRQ